MVKNRFWKLFLDVMLPAFCLNCREEGAFLCENCQKKLEIQKHQFCPICYEKSLLGKICIKCQNIDNVAFIDGLLVACPYEEKSLLPRLIHAFKYDFVEDLAVPLSGLLSKCLFENPLGDFVVCPIPLHKKRLRWRGFNQADLLAKSISNEVCVQPLNILKRVHFNNPQMELSKKDRLINTEKAFVLDDNLVQSIPKSTTILLVDDVATTLSTLNSCAKVLKENGFERVVGIVLARVY